MPARRDSRTIESMNSSPATYVIRGGRPGRDRLRVLSSVMAPSTIALLLKLGVACRARVLDLGCGGGEVAAVVARMASLGSVVGIDADPEVVAIARAELRDAGLHNVDVRVGDVTALDDDLGRFDVVHARFLLSHLREPEAMMRRMVELCQPGGAVVVQDVDIAGALCSPSNEAFDACLRLYCDTARARGGDPALGPRLPAMLRAAGVADVRAAVLQPGALTGDAKRIQLLTLENIAPAATALGLITNDEIARLATDLRAFVERDDTFVTAARVVQAWGRVVTPSP